MILKPLRISVDQNCCDNSEMLNISKNTFSCKDGCKACTEFLCFGLTVPECPFFSCHWAVPPSPKLASSFHCSGNCLFEHVLFTCVLEHITDFYVLLVRVDFTASEGQIPYNNLFIFLKQSHRGCFVCFFRPLCFFNCGVHLTWAPAF